MNESQVFGTGSNFWNDHSDWVTVGVYIICGVVVGFVAIKVLDPALRVLTAVIGSFLTTASVAYFLEMIIKEPLFLSWNNVFQKDLLHFSLWDQYALWCCIGWGCLGITGSFVQFGGLPKRNQANDLYYPLGAEEQFAHVNDSQRRFV